MLKLKTTAAMLVMATTLFSSTALAAPATQCSTASGSTSRYTIKFYTASIVKKTLNSTCVTSSATNKPATPTPKPAATPKPTATAKPTATPATTPAPAQNASALESAMLSLINAERSNNGLSPLSMDGTLVTLARQKSTDMVKNNYFAHNSPTYGSASDMVKNAGLKVSAVGENIAHHGSMEKAHAALMSSTGHRANILGKSYNAIGIGIVSDKNGYPMITQIFVRK